MCGLFLLYAIKKLMCTYVKEFQTIMGLSANCYAPITQTRSMGKCSLGICSLK